MAIENLVYPGWPEQLSNTIGRLLSSYIINGVTSIIAFVEVENYLLQAQIRWNRLTPRLSIMFVLLYNFAFS
jgi:hypothetical protein